LSIIAKSKKKHEDFHLKKWVVSLFLLLADDRSALCQSCIREIKRLNSSQPNPTSPKMRFSRNLQKKWGKNK